LGDAKNDCRSAYVHSYQLLRCSHMLPHPKVAEIHAYYYLRIVPSPRKLAKYTYLHLIYAQKVAKNA